MSFHLDICNISVKHEFLDSLSGDEYVKCIHIEKKIQNYFGIDEIFKDYFTNYNKKKLIYILLSANSKYKSSTTLIL